MANKPAKPLTDADQNLLNALSAGFISGTMLFFASVIKSGEPWTETCEQRLAEAKEYISKFNFDRTVKDSEAAHG